jgi:uncharacterized delta-60 repeat protein
VLVLLFPSSGRVQSEAGGLDSSFGTGGKVVTDLSPGFDVVHALTIQNDGKIIAAGTVGFEFALARYNPDGSLDRSFGDGGKVITDILAAPSFEEIHAVALQPDARIVVAGFAGGSGTTNTDFGLARYEPDGSLDRSFGNRGKVTTEFQSFNSTERALVLAIQSDGKILAGGAASPPFALLSQVFGLARYNVDGSLDPTFGSGGKTTVTFVPFSDFNEFIHALAVQPDGKILAAGFVSNDFGMARFNVDGSLDTSFGDGGKVRTDFSGRTDDAMRIALQPDGHILLAGRSIQFLSDEDLALARYDSNGMLDTGFGAGGKVLADFFPTGSGLFGDGLNSIVFQEDGKIIAGGLSEFITRSDFGVARYNQDGTPDSSFGSGGKVVTDFGTSIFGGSREAIFAVELQPDGKIVAAGTDGSTNFALARYDVPVAPDFALGFNATQVIAERGTTLRLVVNVNRRGGFSGAVTVTPPDASSIKVKMKPPSPISTTEATVKYKAKIKGGATTGTHQLTFSGMDQSGRTRAATVTLIIQ